MSTFSVSAACHESVNLLPSPLTLSDQYDCLPCKHGLGKARWTLGCLTHTLTKSSRAVRSGRYLGTCVTASIDESTKAIFSSHIPSILMSMHIDQAFMQYCNNDIEIDTVHCTSRLLVGKS